MTIHTLERSYEIVQKLDEDSAGTAYLCRVEKQGDGEESPLYLMLNLNRKNLHRTAAIWLMDLYKKRTIESYVDCFLESDSLYLVFTYREEKALAPMLEAGELNQKERLAAGRTLMDETVRDELPDYLLYEALSPENVRFSGDGRIFFNYRLTEPNLAGSELFAEICSRIAHWQEVLLREELAAGTIPQVQVWLENLIAGRFVSLGEIYRSYRQVYEELIKLEETDGLRPRPMLLRLWDRRKTALTWIKRVVYIGILCILTGYLFYSLFKPEEGTPTLTFSQVGEVWVEEEETTAGVEEE